MNRFLLFPIILLITGCCLPCEVAKVPVAIDLPKPPAEPIDKPLRIESLMKGDSCKDALKACGMDIKDLLIDRARLRKTLDGYR